MGLLETRVINYGGYWLRGSLETGYCLSDWLRRLLVMGLLITRVISNEVTDYEGY